jgi:hypothetical protein
MKIDSLSLLKKKGRTEVESSNSLVSFALIHSPSHLACTGIIKVYTCVLLCSLLTFEHTRPTANQTKPSSKKRKNKKKKSIRHL